MIETDVIETLTAVDEPVMVFGFISSAMSDKLRRLAAELTCSESDLVSRFVREVLAAKLAIKPQGKRKPI